MLRRRRVILTAIVGFVISATAYADMMPMLQVDTVARQAPDLRLQTYVQQTEFHYPFGIELAPQFLIGGLKPTLQPAAKTYVGQIHQTHSLQITTDGQGSFSLCLYALIGLGLAKCAPLTKRISFGHSFSIPAESFCSAPALCFIQPVYTEPEVLPQRYREAISSLLRKSLFTPVVLGGRGPPLVYL